MVPAPRTFLQDHAMSLSHRPLSSLLLLALLGGISAVAMAAPQQHGRKPPQSSDKQDDRGNQDNRDRGPRNDDALSDSVRKVQRSTRGQVLSAERVPYDGRSLNRIKVVDDRGRVRVYMDDPQQPQAQRPGSPTRSDDD
jgi:hypothetical protein